MRLILCFSLLFSSSILLAQAQWEFKQSMPSTAEGRHHPVTFAIDGYGYVMTGGTDDGNLDDAYKYEAATDTWTQLDAFPGGDRSYAYGVSVGSKGYLGFGSSRVSGGPLTYFNDLWEFDANTETWKELATCPCEGRNHPAFVATSDKIFVGLGNGNMGNTRDWWEYDIASDSWSQKPDFPGARRHHPYYFEIEGLVYVAFGHGDIIFNDLHVYDPATEEWTFLNFLPSQGRVAGTQFSYNGKGYVLSGDGDTHENLPQGEMWSYDPATNEWTSEKPHPGPGRWAPGSFVIGDNVYFTGGDYLVLYNDLLSFNLAGGNVDTEDTEDATIDLTLYPNPSSGLVHIQHDEPISQVKVYNTMGQMILDTKDLNNNQLDLSELNSGNYHLELTIKQTQPVITKNIIIKK